MDQLYTHKHINEFVSGSLCAVECAVLPVYRACAMPRKLRQSRVSGEFLLIYTYSMRCGSSVCVCVAACRYHTMATRQRRMDDDDCIEEDRRGVSIVWGRQ